MTLEDILIIIGGIGFIGLIFFIILIPTIAVIILGHYTATQYFHLTGIVYWAYMIMFYITTGLVIGSLRKILNI